MTTLNTSSTSTSSSSTSTISDDVAKVLDRLQKIEKATVRAAMLTKRMLETPLPEPQMVEPERASAKRRRRTRYTPLLGILEMQCTWLRVRGRLRGAPNCMDGVQDGFLRMCMPRLVLRSSSACCREKQPVLRLRARHVHGDPDGFFFLYASGHSTDKKMDSDKSLSHTVPNVGLTRILQSTR